MENNRIVTVYVLGNDGYTSRYTSIIINVIDSLVDVGGLIDMTLKANNTSLDEVYESGSKLDGFDITQNARIVDYKTGEIIK